MKNKLLIYIILVIGVMFIFFKKIHFNINDIINLAFANKAYFTSYQNSINVNEEFDNIEQIELNLHRGDLKIVNGNKVAIKGSNVDKSCYNYMIDNNKLIIEEKKSVNTTLNGNASYILTIPSSTPLLKIIANCYNGSVKFNDIYADEVIFQVKKGSLEGFKLNTSNLNIDAGIGSVNLHNILSQNINIISGMGSVNVDCKINGDDGDIKIDSSMGSVNLKLDNNPADFYYNLAKRHSSVNIDGVKATNYKYYNNDFNKSKYGLIIGSGISSVEICFNNNNIK